MHNSLSPGEQPLISIIYYSGDGHTAEMSHAVAKGALSAGDVSVVEHQIVGEEITNGRWVNDAVLAQGDRSGSFIYSQNISHGHPNRRLLL